jgi:hypothetical protein
LSGSQRQTDPKLSISGASISIGVPQGTGSGVRKRIPLPEMSHTRACMSGPGIIPNTLTVTAWSGLKRGSLLFCSTVVFIGQKEENV